MATHLNIMTLIESVLLYLELFASKKAGITVFSYLKIWDKMLRSKCNFQIFGYRYNVTSITVMFLDLIFETHLIFKILC